MQTIPSHKCDNCGLNTIGEKLNSFAPKLWVDKDFFLHLCDGECVYQMSQELERNLNIHLFFKGKDIIKEIILNDEKIKEASEKMNKLDISKFTRFMNKYGNIVMNNPEGQLVISQWL